MTTRTLKRKALVETLTNLDLAPSVQITRQLESDPAMAKMILEMNDVESRATAGYITPEVSRWPKPGVPKPLLEERNEYIINLQLMGLSPSTIQRSVNTQARVKGWWEIENVRSIRRIIADYYNAQKPLAKDSKAFMDWMKEAAFAAQERMIEKLSVYISKKPESAWKPFEYWAIMDSLFRMKQQLIENRNWNASRMNPMISLTQSNQINIYEDNSQTLLVDSDKSPALKRILAQLQNEVED